MRRSSKRTEEGSVPDITPDNLEVLEALSIEQLTELWLKHYGSPPPRRPRVSLMADCLAYRIQEKAYGGLALSTRTRLRKIAADIRAGKQTTLLTAQRIKPGTRLVREWGRETHTVEALELGFSYRGARYETLSQVAGAITGAKWSGPLFFGLRKRSKREAGDHDAA